MAGEALLDSRADRGVSEVDSEDALDARLIALEEEVARLRGQVTTARLVIVDGHGRERFIASCVDPAMELRLPLWAPGPRRDLELLVFAIEGRDDLPGGVGVQLWDSGSVVRELTWWEDETEP